MDSRPISLVERSLTSSDGTVIYADATGVPTSTAIVFIHGFTFCALVFDRLFNNEELARNFYLVRYDMRGHGRSGKPPSQECYTSKSFSEDFVAVCDAFKLQKPFLAGWSLGATVLTDIATHLPKDFLSGAIYLGGLPCTGQTLYDVATSKAICHITELTSADTSVSILRTRDNFFNACLFDPESTPFSLRCMWVGIMGYSLPVGAKEALGREQKLEPLLELGRRGMVSAGSMVGCDQPDYNKPGNTATGFPLLIIQGREDLLINGEAAVNLVSPHFKNLEVHWLERCGHTPQYERADDVAKLITNFVRRVHREKMPSDFLLSTWNRLTGALQHYLFPQFMKGQ